MQHSLLPSVLGLKHLRVYVLKRKLYYGSPFVSQVCPSDPLFVYPVLGDQLHGAKLPANWLPGA
jgi:hypothetical protein